MNRILFPKSIVVVPREKHVTMLDYYWAVTPNSEIIVHKWTDDNLHTLYSPQANRDEKMIKRICQANKVGEYILIPIAYMPFYIMKQYFTASESEG